MANHLYYGDNLDVLRLHVKDKSVDLVYLDPPFNSNADYNVLFGHADGSRAAAQIKAFEDTWRWDQASAATFEQTVMAGGTVAEALHAFRTLLGPSNMLAYLAMMAPRLVELRRVLKSSGSIYLHCDPTASHYLKLLMDAVFGPESFRNEIVWRRTGSNSAAKRLGPLHQTIFYYARSKQTAYYRQYGPYTEGYVRDYFTFTDERGRYRPVLLTGPGAREGDSGQPWRGYDPTASGRHWQPATYVYTKYTELTGDELGSYPLLDRLEKLDEVDLLHWGKNAKVPNYRYYLDDAPGVPFQDIWAYQPGTEGCVHGRPTEGIDQDVKWLTAADSERLGYPTQKPEGLLERIIRSSSRKGDVVLDPFCGCGTTIAAAEKLDRQWIGIDITYLAVALMKSRLADLKATDYDVVGEPTAEDDAAKLAVDDPYQFQWWALGLIGARPTDGKKGGDKGIDGRLFFFDEPGGTAKQLVVSVKAGNLTPAYVRDLAHVVDREGAQLGALISLREPTAGMRAEAASAGFYTSPWGKHPRIQLVTVGELLAGRRLDMPATTGTTVALPAQPAAPDHPEQMTLAPGDEEE